MGWIVFRVFRVVRVPWPNTRTTRNNFGYRGLEPEIRFGFFGFGLFGFGLGFFGLGFRVSAILPTHRCKVQTETCSSALFGTNSADQLEKQLPSVAAVSQLFKRLY